MANLRCWLLVQLSQGRFQSVAKHSNETPFFSQHKTRLRLSGDIDLPSVDVLITCCGEDLNVILDTVRAACLIDYPSTKFRVLVLDDGNSDALNEAVTQLQKEWNNVHYHARGVRPDQHVFAKAGNLNYALFEIQGQMDSPPEFFAVFDADFIPSPDFLRATLPHMLLYPNLAVLSTFQRFYNLPYKDPLYQGLDHFNEVVYTKQSQLGMAEIGGSGFIARRDPIIKLHGFPSISFLEDIMLSLILHGMGHQMILNTEMLQFGLAPTSLEGHVSQRQRWAIGWSQQILALRESKDNTVPLSLRWPIASQGFIFILSLLGQCLSFIVVPLALASGKTLIPSTSLGAFQLQGILSVFYVWLSWLHEWFQSSQTGFCISPFSVFEELWMSPGQVYALAQFYFFPLRSRGSLVTGSTENEWNNNMDSSKKRILELWSNLWLSGVGYTLLCVSSLLGSMVYAATISIYRGDSDTNSTSTAEALLTTVAWPSILNICYLLITWSWPPLSYVLSRPTYPDRKTTLGPHPIDHRAVYPKGQTIEQIQRPRTGPLGCYKHFALVPLVLAMLAISILMIS
ncbi:nucleotide-diphospho-sugar transferase [Talaromyces proteolyticus]|uniref:Nucleotide-diphospho-sugar transferase n=1 Tax=Talaromyces proteolyticus TaxID=1131652 RepID=A0AAD4Q5Q6_9EURO|nr:nucleotide-diphospho-sugar transferase [Talaromyces proteolyticus]KAH8704861.1 nucleotide-diphospho-sugar transferase [Talaromyces proteolyticus]